MKLIVTFIMIMSTTTPGVSFASKINEEDLVEVTGISFKGLKICHQNEWRNLSINMEYEADAGGNSMDLQAMKKHIRLFLENYPNPNDFWEVMNTNLVHSLRQSYPDIISIKNTLTLAPDRTLLFPRESIVRSHRNSDFLRESFNFTKLNYIICQETFRSLNINVAWSIKENPAMSDYPDYLWINEAMDEFFKMHPVSLSNWKSLKPKLQLHLLERFPSLIALDIEVAIAE